MPLRGGSTTSANFRQWRKPRRRANRACCARGALRPRRASGARVRQIAQSGRTRATPAAPADLAVADACAVRRVSVRAASRDDARRRRRAAARRRRSIAKTSLRRARRRRRRRPPRPHQRRRRGGRRPRRERSAGRRARATRGPRRPTIPEQARRTRRQTPIAAPPPASSPRTLSNGGGRRRGRASATASAPARERTLLHHRPHHIMLLPTKAVKKPSRRILVAAAHGVLVAARGPRRRPSTKRRRPIAPRILTLALVLFHKRWLDWRLQRDKNPDTLLLEDVEDEASVAAKSAEERGERGGKEDAEGTSRGFNAAVFDAASAELQRGDALERAATPPRRRAVAMFGPKFENMLQKRAMDVLLFTVVICVSPRRWTSSVPPPPPPPLVHAAHHQAPRRCDIAAATANANRPRPPRAQARVRLAIRVEREAGAGAGAGAGGGARGASAGATRKRTSPEEAGQRRVGRTAACEAGTGRRGGGWRRRARSRAHQSRLRPASPRPRSPPPRRRQSRRRPPTSPVGTWQRNDTLQARVVQRPRACAPVGVSSSGRAVWRRRGSTRRARAWRPRRGRGRATSVGNGHVERVAASRRTGGFSVSVDLKQRLRLLSCVSPEARDAASHVASIPLRVVGEGGTRGWASSSTHSDTSSNESDSIATTGKEARWMEASRGAARGARRPARTALLQNARGPRRRQRHPRRHVPGGEASG